MMGMIVIILYDYHSPAPDVPNFLDLYSMAPETDYAQQTAAVNAIDDETITELMRIVCYDQPIYEDMYLEGDEWLGLTLGVDRSSVLTNVQPRYDQASFKTMTVSFMLFFLCVNDSIPCVSSGCGWSAADILPCLRECGSG